MTAPDGASRSDELTRADDERIPAVIYAAKSTEDKRGSIPTQLTDCRAFAEREGLEVVAEYDDEAVSAFKGNRGEGLARAKADAERLAAERGRSALVVVHSDRLARGDGRIADHLAEVYSWAHRRGVTLRSVQDDHYADERIGQLMAAVMGQRNTEDSLRKAEAVRSGLVRTFERGERLGGPVPDGYLLVRHVDEHGDVQRAYRIDPDRAPIVRLIFELAETMGTPSIARELNRRGHRTRGGVAWTRRRVQDTLANAFYAGRVVIHRGKPDEQVRDGRHPALIPPEGFDRLAELRAVRDRGAGSQRSPRGRPTSTFALARLARCARCGAPMRPVKDAYRRKDGTRNRKYQCEHLRNSTGLCDQPSISAEVVDRAVIANLDQLVIDFEAWRRRIEDGHAVERTRLAREVERVASEVAELERKTTLIEARWERATLDGDDAGAASILRILRRREGDLEAAQRRLQAHRDALAAVPEEAPADAMLDFYTALSAAVRGRMEGADSLAQVNDALRDLFGRFVLDTVPAGVAIRPILSVATAARILADVDGWQHGVLAHIAGSDPVPVHAGENDDELLMTLPARPFDPAGELERHLLTPGAEVEIGLQVRNPPAVIATGDERIVPPMRSIEAPVSELANTHE